MESDLKTAREIYQEYRAKYHDLSNIYFQVKAHQPLEKHSMLLRAIDRIGQCVELWYIIALKLSNKKYFEE